MKYLLIINTIISMIVLIYLWRQDRNKALFLFVILLFMPVMGFVFSGAYQIIERLSSKEKKKNTIAEEEDGDIKLMAMSPTPKEVHVIPVSDALVLNSSKVKKELLINVLREDKTKYIETLKTAIEDEDTEASHYAAVALMDIKDSFNIVIESLDTELEKDNQNISIMIEYAAVLGKSIASGLNDKKRLKNLEERYSRVLGKLLESEHKSEIYYLQKINCDLNRTDFESALIYAKKFKEEYPENEKPYLSLMKFYYAIKNGESFRRTLEELKKSNIILSGEGLKMIRFWLGGVQ